MKVLQYLLGLIAAFALILVLLITSVEAVVYWTPWYFEKEYMKHDVLADVQMEMEDLMDVTDHMMAYLKGDEESLQIETTVAGQQRDFFNAREIAHMADVKNLFLGGLALRRWSLGILALSIAVLVWKKKLEILPKMMVAGTGIFLGAVALLGLVASTDFTRYFTIFHHIFFDNDLWILNPRTDLLINIVPEPFFIDTAMYIGIVFAAAMAVVLIDSIYFMKKAGKKKSGAEKAA